MEEGKIRCAIFPSNTPRDLVLSKNGICLDNFCIKSGGYVNLVGNFRLEATFSNTKLVKETLKQGCILKICDEYGNDEIFRITNISNNNNMVVTIIAFQITITDTKTLWLKDIRPTECNGLSALQKMYNESESNGFKKELFINSDINNKSTAYFQDMNLYDAIHTCDQSFINRWGGEILRNKYTLTVNERIGQDKGVTIREGKNLLGFKSKTDLNSVITVAIGKGYDGIKGDYIESPLKSKYSGANTKVIEYSDVKVRTESDSDIEGFATLEEAKAELNRRVKEEFSKNHIDELKATYEINFLDLSKTEEYKDYVQAERVDIGDIVRVVVDSLDLTLTTRVTEKEIDYLSGRVTKITLSNNPVAVTKSDAEIISGIRNLLIKNNNSDLSNYIDSMMKSGIKDSYVVNRLNETLWMDNQDINLAKNVVKVNKNGLFFSQSGYNGKYTCGFTIDGALNANIIQTGILSTILIKSSDGDNYWDLNTGYMKIKNGYIDGGENYWNLATGELQLGKGMIKGSNSYWNLNTGYFYLNKGKIVGSNSSWDLDTGEINFTKGLIKGGNSYWNLATGEFYLADGKIVGNGSSWDLKTGIINLNRGKIYGKNSSWDLDTGTFKSKQTKANKTYDVEIDGGEIKSNDYLNIYTVGLGVNIAKRVPIGNGYTENYVNCTKYGVGIGTPKGYRINIVSPLIDHTGNLNMLGDLTVSGKKNRVVNTEHYGKIAQNAYETCECYFGDIGRGKLKNGKYIIRLDPKFLETVNTDIQYEVRTWAYGNGTVWVDTSKMYKQYVVVEGTADIEFGYEVIAKQKGYEKDRLEEVTKK